MIHRQSGQALPLGMALLIVGILGGLLVYNTGQTAATKTRVTNAADAAAYSGLQWQARALNFAAYTNRAMLANQVSLAQAVSLTSWTRYGVTMSENLARVLSGIPIVNAIAHGVEAVLGTVNTIVEPVAQAMIQVISGVNRGVAVAQEAMYQSSYLATPEIVEAVVKQSDPRFTSNTAFTVSSVLDALQQWQAFSEHIDDSAENRAAMQERAGLISDSRDAFTRARDWSFFNGFLYVAPFFKIDLKKEGETRLIERETHEGLVWEWKGKDSLSFHSRLRIPFRGWKKVEIPIGYGQAIANTVPEITIEDGACTEINQFRRCQTWARHNKSAERFSDVNLRSLSGTGSRVSMDGYSGLNAFRRLSETSREQGFPTLSLRVEVSAPLENVSSSNEFVTGDILETPHTMPGGVLSALSVAEVYFKPPDADHSSHQGEDVEFANLYSPWWDVRLAPVSLTDKQAAFSLRVGTEGLTQLPSAIPNTHPVGLTDSNTDVTSAPAALVNATNSEAAAAAAFGDVAIGTAERIHESLNAALDTAVADMLNGITGARPDDLTSVDDLESWAAGITQQSEAQGQQIAGNIEGSVSDVHALQAELERLDQVVNDRFTDVFAVELANYRSRTSGLRSRIAGYLGRPVGLFERVPDSHLSDTERDEARELHDELNTFIADLATAYRDIVNAETDRFEMSFAMARDFVITALASYDSTDGDIDWALFGADPVDESMVSIDEPSTDHTDEDAEEGADAS